MIGGKARKILKNLDLKCTKTQKIPLEDGLGFTLEKKFFVLLTCRHLNNQ